MDVDYKQQVRAILLTNLIKFQDVTVNSKRRKEFFNLQ